MPDPEPLVSGDFNGDGRADLVADGTVLLSNGDGTFRTAGAIGGGFVAKDAADINGDGRLDLVAANEQGGMGVFLGKGDGSFASAITPGSSPELLADFNADGRPDAVVWGDGLLSVMLNDGVWTAPPPPKTFVGPGGNGSGGNWSNANNWSPTGVPGPADAVSIGAGKSVSLGGSATVAGLSLTDGATSIVASNGNRVLRTASLAIGGTSKLNLNDNDLIIDYSGLAGSPIGSWNGSVYTGVTGLIARGYNSAAWDGGGLVTTTTDARSGLATLAPAEAADVFGISGNQTSTWNG